MSRSILKTALLTAALTMIAGSAFAQGVRITGVAANGSGCPGGSVTGLINGNLATLLFDSFNVTTTRQRPIQTKSCNVAVALNVDTGLSVTATAFTYMGTMALDTDNRSVGFLNISSGFNGGRMSRRTIRFEDEFNSINEVDAVGAVVFTACRNNQTIARSNTSLTVMGSGVGEIGSVDIAAFNRTIFQLRVDRARC
jgi:hypothetical protein